MRSPSTLPLLLALTTTLTTQAQTNTGTLLGSLTDPQQNPIARGTITVRSADLASTRTLTSDPNGRFALTGLVPGAYVVEAKFNGLTLRRPVRLTVALGTSTQVALQLELPRVRQGTSVTARPATSEGNTVAPPINATESSVSTFLAGMTVTYLPLRDRDVTQFDQLATNAHEDAEDTGLSVAGQRPTALLTQVDGVDFTSPLFGGVRGASDRSFLLPQTTVREFQIVTSGLGADAGRTNAGLINVATKEGSNKPHGEAFYTLRPATLSSADAFGHGLDNFQSTYGASFGGPLRKDRSFYYLGFEQDFLHLPTFFQFAPQAPATTIPTALAATQTQIIERNTPLDVSARFDQALTPRHTLNLELAANRLRIANAAPGFEGGLSRTLAAPSQASSVSGQSFFTRAGLTSVLTPRLVNQALFSWSSDHRGETPNSSAPELFINGFGILGGNALGPHLYTSQQNQLADTLSLVRGKNLFELGTNLNLDPTYEQREANPNGRFDYNSLAAFLANQPRRFQQTFVTGNTRYSGQVRELGLYANAHLELRPSLTVTAGLRWGGQWNPQPPHPNAALPQTQNQTQHIPSDLTQFQPRLGLAWNPLTKTTLRLSSGLYSAPFPATLFHRISADNGTQTTSADSYFDPQLLALTGAFTASPHALASPPSGLSTPSAFVAGLAPNFRNPTSLQAAASLDQTLSPKLTLRAGYLHASTWHLDRRLDENLNSPTANPAGLPIFPSTRPTPGLGRFLVEQSSAHSSYNALSFAALAQLSRRTQFTVNYTLARTRDDDSNLGPYSLDSAQNPFNLHAEQAFSNLDQRHTLNASAIFNLPFGLKFNPLLIAHSGAPYTALIGFDTQNDANDFNDRALVNGLTSTRNQFRQPAFTDTDLRLVKDFTLKGEGHHLDLFMDVFNLFGAANRTFGPEQISLYGTSASPVPSAAQPLFAPGASRLGGPREIQFTARLVAF